MPTENPPGSNQTDEDMFRALLLFPPGVKKVTMPAPVSVTLVDDPNAQPVDLKIEAEAVFTTAVGHSSKRTLAAWHVNTPHEVVDHTLALVKNVPFTFPPAPASADGEKAGL